MGCDGGGVRWGDGGGCGGVIRVGWGGGGGWGWGAMG